MDLKQTTYMHPHTHMHPHTYMHPHTHMHNKICLQLHLHEHFQLEIIFKKALKNNCHLVLANSSHSYLSAHMRYSSCLAFCCYNGINFLPSFNQIYRKLIITPRLKLLIYLMHINNFDHGILILLLINDTNISMLQWYHFLPQKLNSHALNRNHKTSRPPIYVFGSKNSCIYSYLTSKTCQKQF